MENGNPIPHGYAVAWGMIVELYLSHRICGFPKEKLLKTVRYIQQHYGAFPISCDNYEALYEITRHDKKNVGNYIYFTLLSEIGNVRIDQTTDKNYFEALDFQRFCWFVIVTDLFNKAIFSLVHPFLEIGIRSIGWYKLN